MGISQHTTGTDNARCLIALCSITGNVGRPGTGLHPCAAEQCAGRSDAGLVPMFYPDYQGVDRAAAQRRFEEAWGMALNPNRGLTVTEIIKSVLQPDGVRAMYMLGENRSSRPEHQQGPQGPLGARLPRGAGHIPHRDGRVPRRDPPGQLLHGEGRHLTNTDRRVQLGRKVMDPPGGARPDWQIVQEIAQRIGLAWDYRAPSEVFDEMVALMPSYHNLSYANLGLSGKALPERDPEHSDGTIVMFDERFNTDDGLAHLVPAQWLAGQGAARRGVPARAQHGRLLEHWHTGSMTRRSFALDAIAPSPRCTCTRRTPPTVGWFTARWCVSARVADIELLLRVSPASSWATASSRSTSVRRRPTPHDRRDRPGGEDPEFKFCAVQ